MIISSGSDPSPRIIPVSTCWPTGKSGSFVPRPSFGLGEPLKGFTPVPGIMIVTRMSVKDLFPEL